ncbi:hypothetical protein ACWJJH_09595 [Endozoicomonadaceae bacterium StTr2]
MHRKYGTGLILFLSVLLIVSSKAFSEEDGKAWVCGFAQAQGGYRNWDGTYDNLSGVEVRVLETGERVAVTGDDGIFCFQYPIGEELTLLFKAGRWYQPSQSETITVQATSLGDERPEFSPQEKTKAGYKSSEYPNFITYQAIARHKFYFIAWARRWDIYRWTWGPSDFQKGHFQMIVTAAEEEKTLYHTQQGADSVTINLFDENTKRDLKENEDIKDLHFCYYGAGLCCSHTDPFCQPEKETTVDGGVLIANIPPSERGRIRVKAKHYELEFNSCVIRPNPNWWEEHAKGETMFINISPPALRVQPRG